MHSTPNSWPSFASAAFLMALAGSADASTFALNDNKAAGEPHLAAGKAYASGVIVDFRASGIATVGQPFPVTVDFSQVDARGAKVSFSSDAALKLGNARARTLPAGKTSITLTATPSANGLSFIHVFTRQGTGGSAISIPVQVGPQDTAQKPDAQLKTGPGGRPVKLLPIR